jgi:4'-phosphopantetheinyl transferase
MAHSGSVALYGFALESDIGVDVEFKRAGVAMGGIAGRYFSALEVAELMALPAEALIDGFFACWVRKEAYIKARGEGISIGLNSFTVSVAPDQPARLVWAEFDSTDPLKWNLIDIDAGPSYAAAIAMEKRLTVLLALQVPQLPNWLA